MTCWVRQWICLRRINNCRHLILWQWHTNQLVLVKLVIAYIRRSLQSFCREPNCSYSAECIVSRGSEGYCGRVRVNGWAIYNTAYFINYSRTHPFSHQSFYCSIMSSCHITVCRRPNAAYLYSIISVDCWNKHHLWAEILVSKHETSQDVAKSLH